MHSKTCIVILTMKIIVKMIYLILLQNLVAARENFVDPTKHSQIA